MRLQTLELMLDQVTLRTKGWNILFVERHRFEGACGKSVVDWIFVSHPQNSYNETLSPSLMVLGGGDSSRG